jgi:threonine aldolase
MRDPGALSAQCTRRLAGHSPRTLREQLVEVAESPQALDRLDHYGQGGVIADLERDVAELLGKEEALFMPSGTMAQPIALRIWSDQTGIPTVAFHPTCHLEIHEYRAFEEIHGLRSILLGERERLFTIKDLQQVDEPISTLLIELPQREIGGQLPEWDELMAICQEARSRGARLHMDGARLWECAPYYRKSYAEIAAPFDSVYVSFYKILGGLPGAILAGPALLIEEARIWQRRQDGNLYQQAANAISSKLGMHRHLPRIIEYVERAQEIAAILKEFKTVRVVPENPPANMMHLYFGRLYT